MDKCCPIRIWASHMSIRIWDVPYMYGPVYAYEVEQYQEYIIKKRVSNFHVRTLSKMSPLSNPVYSSVFTYNPNVLMRPYKHLTIKASIQLHHLMCITLDISLLIVTLCCACSVDSPASHQKQICLPSTKVSRLFDESSNNNASNDGSKCSS